MCVRVSVCVVFFVLNLFRIDTKDTERDSKEVSKKEIKSVRLIRFENVWLLLTSPTTFSTVALLPTYACVNIMLARARFFLLPFLFPFLFFCLFNLQVVVPYGRTDGHRGLSKLLLHGTRENRNTPENYPSQNHPSPSIPPPIALFAFYEPAV